MKYPLILKLSVGAVALDCVGKVSGIVNKGYQGQSHTVTVDPCEKCLSEERDAGYDEGRSVQ